MAFIKEFDEDVKKTSLEIEQLVRKVDIINLQKLDAKVIELQKQYLELANFFTPAGLLKYFFDVIESVKPKDIERLSISQQEFIQIMIKKHRKSQS